MLPADTALAIEVWFGFRWADSNSNLKIQNLVETINFLEAGGYSGLIIRDIKTSNISHFNMENEKIMEGDFVNDNNYREEDSQ